MKYFGNFCFREQYNNRSPVNKLHNNGIELQNRNRAKKAITFYERVLGKLCHRKSNPTKKVQNILNDQIEDTENVFLAQYGDYDDEALNQIEEQSDYNDSQPSSLDWDGHVIIKL